MKQNLDEQATLLRSQLAEIEREQRYQGFPILYEYLKENNYNFSNNFADKVINDDFAVLIQFYRGSISASFQDRKQRNVEIYPYIFCFNTDKEKNESVNPELDAIEQLKNLALPIRYKMYFAHEMEFYYNSSNMEEAKESCQDTVDYMKARDFSITIQKLSPTD